MSHCYNFRFFSSHVKKVKRKIKLILIIYSAQCIIIILIGEILYFTFFLYTKPVHFSIYVTLKAHLTWFLSFIRGNLPWIWDFFSLIYFFIYLLHIYIWVVQIFSEYIRIIKLQLVCVYFFSLWVIFWASNFVFLDRVIKSYFDWEIGTFSLKELI